MTIRNDIKLPPWTLRGKIEFFVLYRPNSQIPAIQIQLPDGRTYDVYSVNFGRIPQFTRLPKWEECLRRACADGQAVYIFGDTEDADYVSAVETERETNAEACVARNLRADAIRSSRISRLRKGLSHISPRRSSAF